MSANLHYNVDHSGLEVSVGEIKWAEPVEPGDESLILDDEDGAYLVTTEHADFDGLEPNTVYQLVKVSTSIGSDEDFAFDAEDDEEAEGAEE